MARTRKGTASGLVRGGRVRGGRVRGGRAKGGAAGSRFRPLWWLATLVVVGVVLGLTVREDELVTWANLTGANYVPLKHHLAALRCVLDDCAAAAEARHYLLVDVVGNLLLFVPVGVVLAGAAPLRGRAGRFILAVLGAALLSTAIEFAQLWLPSRATDVDDVLFNTLGATVGAVLLVAFVGRR